MPRKSTVDPAITPSVGAPPPEPSAGAGQGAPTGNAGFAMDEATMGGLQSTAGDLRARLSGIAGELRGLNLAPTALGPIGLAAVPAFNAANDQAVAQADRGSKAYGEIQSGLRASHEMVANNDTRIASLLTGIDPDAEQSVHSERHDARPALKPVPDWGTVTGPQVTPQQQAMLDLHGARPVEVGGADPRQSLVEAVAATVAPDSPAARQAFLSKMDGRTSGASTIDDVAAAANARVHVLGPDGKFTSHGPVTGAPVHVVEVRTSDGGIRYRATKEVVHIGRPEVAYPGPTKLPVHGSDHTVHRGEFEVETVAGRHFVRVYTAVVNPATFDMTDPARPTSPFKDIQQDPATGTLNISTGSNAQLWAGAGRPQRALQWLAKYEQTDGGQPIDPRRPGEVKRPVLRSFLVPLDTYTRITSGATVEGAPGSTSRTHTYNVDQRGEPNQFGIGGDHLAELVKHAEPGSLISYPSNPSASFAHSDLAGRITPVADLYQRLGLGPDFRSDVLGKAYDPWFSWTRQSDGSWTFGGFRNDARRLHKIATDLREHHVTYQQSKQDPALRGRQALIEPDARPGSSAYTNRDTSYAARFDRLNRFLNETGPASANVGKLKADVLSTAPGALRDHLAHHGNPTADQTTFRRVMDKVVPDALKDATNDVDALVKQMKGPVTTRADLENLIKQGFRPKSGPVRLFSDQVVDKVVDRFASQVERHPDLALLTGDSRKLAADALRDRVKQALTDQFADLGDLEPYDKGGKKGGWLSGPRLAEFGRQVEARLSAQPIPVTEVTIDPAKLVDVARHKVLTDVVTGALHGFTGQDLVNTRPDHLKALVANDVLPKYAAGVQTALREHPAMSLADKHFRDAMAEAVAHDAHVRAEHALSGFAFDPVDPAKVDALMAKVPEIATQAEIGSLIATDSDQIATDPRTRLQDGNPFLNAYHQWRSEHTQGG